MLLEASPAAAIFKVVVLPAQHAALFANLQEIASRASLPHALVARARRTVYFALLPPSANDETTARLANAATQIFDSIFACGGHVTLLFASLALKKQLNIWGHLPVAPASLQAVLTSAASTSRSHLNDSPQLSSPDLAPCAA